MKFFPAVFSRTILILLLILTILAQGFSKEKEKLNQKWLKKDEAALSEAISFIEAGDFSDQTLRAFGKCSVESRALGFGLERCERYISAGYLGVHLTYIADKNAPIKAVFTVSEDNFQRIQAELKKSVRSAFLKHFKLVQNFGWYSKTYEARFEFPENYTKYAQKKEKIVGKSEPLSLSEEAQKCFDYLFSAETDGCYGFIGGYEAAVPFERTLMEKLLELKSEAVFLSLLKADNPEARIYAAEGLLTLNDSAENVDAINRAFAPHIADGIEYNTIDGCFMSSALFKPLKHGEKPKFLCDF